MALEKVETAGREGCSQRQDAFQATLRSFGLIPRARDSGVALSTVCFRKCSLSASQRVNWMVIRQGQGDGWEGCSYPITREVAVEMERRRGWIPEILQRKKPRN